VRYSDWAAYARWQDAQSALAEDTKFKELLERTRNIHQVTERIITVEIDI
jgi:sensor c-di-GMP phosphodiesterase-like protein